MYNDENNQYNPRPRFDPKTGERIHYDDENTTETTQTESSEYRYSAGNIPFEQENNNTSYYQQSSTFQQDTTYQQAGAGQGSLGIYYFSLSIFKGGRHYEKEVSGTCAGSLHDRFFGSLWFHSS